MHNEILQWCPSLYHEFFPVGTVYLQALGRICSVDFNINRDDGILSLKCQRKGNLLHFCALDTPLHLTIYPQSIETSTRREMEVGKTDRYQYSSTAPLHFHLHFTRDVRSSFSQGPSSLPRSRFSLLGALTCAGHSLVLSGCPKEALDAGATCSGRRVGDALGRTFQALFHF